MYRHLGYKLVIHALMRLDDICAAVNRLKVMTLDSMHNYLEPGLKEQGMWITRINEMLFQFPYCNEGVFL